jgi:tyrosinase
LFKAQAGTIRPHSACWTTKEASMSTAHWLTDHVCTVCLLAAVALAWPAGAFADCGCGAGCQCGPDCQCGDVPPPNLPGPGRSRGTQVRKNQASLSADERAAFVNAVLALKNMVRPGGTISIYDEYVQAHMLAMGAGQAHEGPAFLPWHRAFLRSFERDLQAVDPTVTIPYWDFTVDNTPDASLWDDDFLGGNGDPDENYTVLTGPFAPDQWPVLFDGPHLRRSFGLWVDDLPTAQDVDDGFLIDTYDEFPYDVGSVVMDSFRNYIEGWNRAEPEMHNRVHNWVGGSMLTMMSPNDPVFWLLHANLDRLWAQWIDLYGLDTYPVTGAPPGHNRRDPMVPFGITPESMFDHHALGYVYDTERQIRPSADAASPQPVQAVPTTRQIPISRNP